MINLFAILLGLLASKIQKRRAVLAARLFLSGGEGELAVSAAGRSASGGRCALPLPLRSITTWPGAYPGGDGGGSAFPAG